MALLEPTVHDATPHPYQVAGQKVLLRDPQGLVLKPLIPRELAFYENLQTVTSLAGLLPFTAVFAGVARCRSWRRIAAPPSLSPEARAVLSGTVGQASTPGGSTVPAADVPGGVVVPAAVLAPIPHAPPAPEPGCAPRKSGDAAECGCDEPGCDGAEDEIYLRLQDVTLGWSHPSIVDIKIGQVGYGPDAPPSKVLSHEHKSATTTSGSLGLRICGMQVFQPATRSFMCHDKLFGRSLTPDSFPVALRSFFDNGQRFCVDVVGHVAVMVARIEEAFVSLNSHRIRASSLLVLYDGDLSATGPCPRSAVDVRLLDFAHAYPTPPGEDGPDEGVLVGLRNLRRILATMEADWLVAQRDDSTAVHLPPP